MAETANSTSANYTLPSGSEIYTSAITPLTTANSPASVTIDGGNRVVIGSANRFTICAGVTITLKNITFKILPFTVSAGGTLVLDTGAVVTENAGTSVIVSGESATAKGTLEMRAGSSVTKKGDSGVKLDGNGVFKMSGGIISDNTSSSGGGMLIHNSVFTMNGGTISGNTAIDGGGAYMRGANVTFNMERGEITGNTASGQGGGLFLATETTITSAPAIGTKVEGKGSIYSNTPNDVWSTASFATLVKRMAKNANVICWRYRRTSILTAVSAYRR
jgi:hypothetical protein